MNIVNVGEPVETVFHQMSGMLVPLKVEVSAACTRVGVRLPSRANVKKLSHTNVVPLRRESCANLRTMPGGNQWILSQTGDTQEMDTR